MNEFALRVPGMTCDRCVRAVSNQVSDVEGVTTVTVDLATKTVRIRGDAEPGTVRAAIAEAGYEAQPCVPPAGPPADRLARP